MNWLLLFLIHNMAISLFRALGALARNIVIANALGALVLMFIIMLGGFVLPRGYVHPWWIWGYWIGKYHVFQPTVISQTKCFLF